MTCLDGITDSMDVNLGKFQETVRNREAWCAAVHGCRGPATVDPGNLKQELCLGIR